jgi:hypothetical protein
VPGWLFYQMVHQTTGHHGWEIALMTLLFLDILFLSHPFYHHLKSLFRHHQAVVVAVNNNDCPPSYSRAMKTLKESE